MVKPKGEVIYIRCREKTKQWWYDEIRTLLNADTNAEAVKQLKHILNSLEQLRTKMEESSYHLLLRKLEGLVKQERKQEEKVM